MKSPKLDSSKPNGDEPTTSKAPALQLSLYGPHVAGASNGQRTIDSERVSAGVKDTFDDFSYRLTNNRSEVALGHNDAPVKFFISIE